jgi:hypothetical protein
MGVATRTRDLGDNLTIIRALRNTQTALDYYHYMKSKGFNDLRHHVSSLDNFRHGLLGDKKFDDAIRVLQLNVAEYPQMPIPMTAWGRRTWTPGNAIWQFRITRSLCSSIRKITTQRPA